MCTGLEIAAAAALIGGAGMQAKGAIDAGNGQRRAATEFAQKQTELMRRQEATNTAALAKVAEQQARQQEFRNQADAVTSAAIDRNSRPEQEKQLQDLTDTRVGGYKSISNLVPVTIDLAGSKNAPAVVADSISNAIGRATSKGEQQATARAAMEAFGDLGIRNNIGSSRSAESIGTLRNLNNISSVIAEAEKNNANTMAGITSSQIENFAHGSDLKAGVTNAKAANAKAIGDLMFAAGSAGMGASSKPKTAKPWVNPDTGMIAT
ncbi:MAG: hypothetical protein V4721_00430 [Bacteroidota bacterium]